MKPSAIVELKLYVQWKANALLKVSSIKPLSNIITKKEFYIGFTARNFKKDTMNMCTASELKI